MQCNSVIVHVNYFFIVQSCFQNDGTDFLYVFMAFTNVKKSFLHVYQAGASIIRYNLVVLAGKHYLGHELNEKQWDWSWKTLEM